MAGPGPGKKVFFSEEKNQKTLPRCRGPCRRHKHLKNQKSFASFLQKRRPSLLAHAVPRQRSVIKASQNCNRIATGRY
jgi:hypothetical protein